MNLIKQITALQLQEDAAGGAIGGGAIGIVPMPLFATLVKQTMAPKPTIIKYSKKKKPKKNSLGIREAYYHLSENDPTISPPKFDTTDVISKLKSLETKEKTDTRDTVTFGLEDDNGGLVRVTVKNEQAADFEKALQAFMSDIDEDEELPEIAELLYKLKDRFDIVDIAWPEVSEDEEQEQGLDIQPGTEGEVGAEGTPAGEEGLDLDTLDAGSVEGGEDTGQIKDLLTQVIDMMKADADARKAEAQAKAAEAKEREAEAAAKMTDAKVKQEEQMLDMEAYNKSKKEESKEAKRLAQLARWKHEMSNGEGGEESYSPQSLGGVPEEEEFARTPQKVVTQQPHKGSTIRGRVHPHDIAQFILNRVK